ncbi:MAG: helix-turn-helix transcriptional regulator [Lachnospiraceae bacterium]|nr:helix-turn-helix transcriptional regulator [Lachnospiraceae bacterium]
MYKKRPFFVRFFLTYITVAIPVLIASVFATNVVLQEMLKMETEVLQRQLEDAETEFLDLWLGYYDESVLIASRAELLPLKMLGHPTEAYDGIETLKIKKSFDYDIFSVFVTYGNDNVYSSSGVARKQVYFSAVMGCNEESIQRGIQSIESSADTVTLLFKDNAEGLILCSYKIYRSGEPLTSVNFVLPFDELNDIFTLSYPGQYYELTMKDGSSLILGLDSDGKIGVIDREEWENEAANKNYTILEGMTNEQIITVRLYYDKMAFTMSKWLYRVQTVNIALIILGITLSAIISWLFSRKQIKEIAALENAAKGEQGQALSAKNVYHELQNQILQGVYQNQRLEESILEHKEKLRDKMLYMIFAGLFREPEKLDLAFQELGFDGVPDKFFVGAISTAENLSEDHIPALLKECMWTRNSHNEKQIVIFLYELQKEDENQLQRRKIAEEIRHQLHQQKISKVRIGMSRVYTNSILIDCGCTEAIQMLDDLVSEKIKDYCGCKDCSYQQKNGILFEEKILDRFDEALCQLDYDEALKSFRNLLYVTSSGECTLENKIYLRYVILQHIVCFLGQTDNTDKGIFMEECINISVEREREFTNSVISILQRLLVRKEDDSFRKILDYINRNYQNCNLTYEEVAAAGGISKTYISKIFRTNLGMSYIEYLTRVRLEKACALLRTTDINISTVAEMVGYANAASFRRAFKEKYGIRASDYRKNESEFRDDE